MVKTLSTSAALKILAPILNNDAERVRALLEYSILDSDPEKEYDDIAMLASEICSTPISSIGFIDETRQVSKTGRKYVIPREMTFCTHTINSTEDIFIIPDSREDKRFANNPGVTGAPHIVFYAGVSLVNPDGFALGTLCVVDTQPRELTGRQQKLLKALANQVMMLLEARKNNMELVKISGRLQDQAGELKEVNKELESFSYTVSHDLQSPLGSILGFSRMFQKKYGAKLDEQGKELLNTIDDSAKRMSELIKDLLAFSKLGKVPLQIKDVDVNELVKEIIEDVKHAMPNFNAEIKLGELNSCSCDQALVRQVWANLISNAAKYSAKKDKPVIEIEMKQVNNEWVYCVKDNGAGFDMKYADKLFAVFQRMHGAEEFEGTGIGLATVYRIITKHGGKIWAESKVDEGAVFYFTLSKLQGTPQPLLVLSPATQI